MVGRVCKDFTMRIGSHTPQIFAMHRRWMHRSDRSCRRLGLASFGSSCWRL